MPVLILLALVPVQAGLWWHAQQAAELAAEEALDAAQVPSGTAADGRAAAHAVLGQVGNVTNLTVEVVREDDAVRVTIRSDLGFSILPGGWTVSAHAEGPTERFVSEDDR